MALLDSVTMMDGRAFKVGDRVVIRAGTHRSFNHEDTGTITEIVAPGRGGCILFKVQPDNMDALEYPETWPIDPKHYGPGQVFCKWRDHGKSAGNIRLNLTR